MVYFAEYPSPVGQILLTGEDRGLTGLWMNRKPADTAVFLPEHPVLRQAVKWLDAYFCGEACPIEFPLAPAGTPFQMDVWNRLLEIPWGSVCTYGDIAREMEAETGKRMSAQAVGGAVGSNPISILIPCHRVVGAKGKLTGYAWGLETKTWLLRHEGWEGVNNDHQ